VQRSAAVLPIKAGFLFALVPFDAGGFHVVRPSRGHAEFPLVKGRANQRIVETAIRPTPRPAKDQSADRARRFGRLPRRPGARGRWPFVRSPARVVVTAGSLCGPVRGCGPEGGYSRPRRSDVCRTALDARVGPMARSFPLVSGAVQGPERRHWEGGQPVAIGELLFTRVQDARAEPLVQSPDDVAQAAEVVGRVDGLYGLDLDADHGPVGVLQDHVLRHADQPTAEPGVGDDQRVCRAFPRRWRSTRRRSGSRPRGDCQHWREDGWPSIPIVPIECGPDRPCETSRDYQLSTGPDRDET